MFYVIRISKVFLALLLVLLARYPVYGIAPTDHPDIASRCSYMVAMDGVQIGRAYKLEGGAISARVGLKKPPGGTMMHPDLTLIGDYEYSGVTVQFTDLYPPLAAWINASWDGKLFKNLRIACFSPDGIPVWDRTLEFCSIQEVIIKECVFDSVSAPSGLGMRIAQPGVFAVKFQAGNIVDSSGPFPIDSGSTPNTISIRDSMPNFALDGQIAFKTVAVEPISITVHNPLGRGPGADPDDISRTMVSNIVASVPFANANGLLTWAKTWLPWTGGIQDGAHDASIEKNGTMKWIDEHGKATCTLNLTNIGVCGYEYTSDSDTYPLAKVSLYCEKLNLLVPGVSPGILTTPEPSQTTETAPKAGIQRKGVALRSSGTALGTPRKVGPFELVVKSAEYLTTPLLVAGNDLSPTAEQKLFVVTYTLRNPSVEMQKVDSGTVGFQAFDVSGATYNDFKVGIGTRMAGISGANLIQDDTLGFSAVIIIPAVESITKLRVTCPSNGSMVEYKFESAK